MSADRSKRLPPGYEAIRRSAPIVLLFAASGLAHADSLVWLNKNFFKAIQWSGRRVLSYHKDSVTGDGDAYNSLNYFGQASRPITDYGQVNVIGRRVLGVLNFNMQLQHN